jgi:photosystem II stability/assembly factor-like uncharacterized protein
MDNPTPSSLKACLSLFFTTLSVCVALITIPANAQFREKSYSGNQYEYVNGMSFLTPLKGFVAYSKRVGYTQDSGKTFVDRPVTIQNTNFNGYPVNLTFDFNINGIIAFTADSLLIYGDYGLATEPAVLFSRDQGQTWKVVYHQNLTLEGGNSGVMDMKFPGNTGLGFAICRGRILKTVNRGQSWTTSYQSPGEYFTKIDFPSSSEGYVIGSNSIYLTFSNG